MDIRSQSALLACIVCLSLAVSVLLRRNRPRALTLFSVLSLSLCAYYLGQFLFTLSGAEPWMRVKVATGSLVPPTTLAFFSEFLGMSPRFSRRARRYASVCAAGGIGLACSPWVTNPMARTAMGVVIYGILMLTVSLVWQRARSSESRVDRGRLAYLAVGSAVAILLSAADHFELLGSTFPQVGALVTTIYMFFLAQTQERLRLLDLHELLGKVASVSVLALILAALFGVLVLWVGDRPGLFVFNTVIASFVIIILFEQLRVKVDELVVATFFRERFELIRTLGALKARIASVIDVRELAKLVLETLNESRRVTHASIFLLADYRPGFFLLDHRGPSPTLFLDAAAARGILSAANTGQKALLLENIERRVTELRSLDETRRVRDELKRLTDIRAAMAQLRAGITIPLSGGDRIIGFFNLGDERVPEAFASDEIALLLEIAERVAVVVENSKLYDRMKERDRLAALGEMAAGLAHEIRNPLGAIKGAAQYLDPKRLPGEDGEFLSVIVDEVNRLNGVVSAFLDYSRPLKQSFGPTDINDVISRTTKLLLGESAPKNVEIKLELAENLPKVMADPDQLKQVFINLFLNAIQAMPKGGNLTIATQRPGEEMGAWRVTEFRSIYEMVEIRFKDTGSGIPEDSRQHIFVPFYTTKEKGTGLGLAICQRIVKNHGGTIAVSSKQGEGTEFVIRLPALLEPSEQRPADGTPYPGSINLTGDGKPTPQPERRSRREKRRGLPS